MGDKQRSKIQKPVKNTLLSGASQGFPFENFQGNSLLIPVSQDSPSVLSDSAGDANKSYIKEFIEPENLPVCAVNTKTSESSPSIITTNESTTASHGYTGIFSSFFSGGSQKKEEMEFGQTQSKNLKEVSHVPPASQSSFVTIPSVQSFSPALHVPVAPENPQNNSSIGLPHDTISAQTYIVKSQEPSVSYLNAMVGSNKNSSVSSDLLEPDNSLKISKTRTFFKNDSSPKADKKNPQNNASIGSPDDSIFIQTYIVKSQEPSEPYLNAMVGSNENSSVAKDFLEPDNSLKISKTRTFFKNDSLPKADENDGNQKTKADIGFEAFSAPEGPNLTKAQSAVDLVGGGFHEYPSSLPAFFSNPNSTSSFSQTRTGSADLIIPFQSESVDPSTPPSAPPMSSGVANKNYRRDQHKRPTYAPVPGLTSYRTVSSSYLSPCKKLSIPLSISPSISGNEKTLSGSLSQPALSISNVNLSSSKYSTSSSSESTCSFSNFCSSDPAIFTKGNPHDVPQHVDLFPTGQPVSSFESHSAFQSASNHNFPSPLNNIDREKQVPVELAPQSPSKSCIVTPHDVHPPIMSTREQAPTHIPATQSERSPSPTVVPAFLDNLANLGSSGIIYRPVYHHWFMKIETKDSKEIWQPFSMTDSLALEQAFTSESLTPETVVPTDGGRYDVNIVNRIRTSVYWEEEPKTVRRCSWFYKSTTESRLHPYDENTAYNLEEEYKKAVTTKTWSRRVELPTGDSVMMYGPNSMALFQDTPHAPEGWEAEPDFTQTEQRRPKIIKRGVLDDFDIEEGESPIVDHLIFVVHGIGSVCDFRCRTIEEAVSGFRAKSLKLIKSHFQAFVDEGIVNRVEVLPVSWHNHLHGENTGVDKKLKTITLKSIPRLRHFTNDTLLDILFYTSPVYCQNIVQQVGKEINTLYTKFKTRNQNFTGGVSLVGHSLGSLILFDTLCHQKSPSPHMDHIQEESKTFIVQQSEAPVVSPDKKKRSLSRNVSYVIGNAGTGQPFIEYPQFSFQPLAFFAMGSPIGMFVTVRGIDSLGLDFCLPTCSRFFNVFHPFDPVAYRIEALINPDLAEKRPVLIPHHKGRKRMHLELKETMARVGADLKQRLVDSVRSTWNTVYQLTTFGRADDGLEQEVDQVIEKQLERQRSESVGNGISETEEADFNAGRLNQGRRIDYVLQEAPLESFNEYVSALTSHVIYWDSEDTILLILKEIYGSMGISADNQNNIIPPAHDGLSHAGDLNDGHSTSYANNMPSTSAQDKQPSSYGFK